MPDTSHRSKLSGFQTREVAKSQAAHFLRKASEHLANALAARRGDNWNSTVLLAVHAAITAADGAMVSRAGIRNSSPTHMDQVRLLRAIFSGPEAERAARQLAAILDRKHIVEYEARLCSASDAETAVKHAERILAWAQSVVQR